MDQDQDKQESQNYQPNQQYDSQPPVSATPEQFPLQQPEPSQLLSERGYNTLAVVGFILVFLMPIIGVVLCIIALGKIKESGEKGYGLAKAGIIIFLVMIVLLVTGVALALFLNSKSSVPGTSISGNNVQATVRDIERKNDINYMHNLLESYGNANSYYPTKEVYESQIWAQEFTSNWDLNKDVFNAPLDSEFYLYDVSVATCDKEGCDAYVISTQLEVPDSGSSTYSKSSLK